MKTFGLGAAPEARLPLRSSCGPWSTPHSHLTLKCERTRLYFLILLAPFRSRTLKPAAGGADAEARARVAESKEAKEAGQKI
jgi:hypothetical protein